MKYSTLLFIIPLIFFSCQKKSSEVSKITLIGQIYDRESDTLVIAEFGEDIRYSDSHIPISETGSFLYQFDKPGYLAVYSLAFQDELNKGLWRPIPFDISNDTIRFELFPIDEYDKNKLVGSVLLQQQIQLNREWKKAFKSSYNHIYAIMDSLEKLNADASEIALAQQRLDSLQLKSNIWTFSNYMENGEMFGYTSFMWELERLKGTEPYSDQIIELYNFFSTKYPNHPYTEMATLSYNAWQGVKPGGMFADFTATDSLGLSITLSEELQEYKLTLLDLWAPWCGPCIKKSKNVQKEFDELSSKGLGVVAVVGGIDESSEFYKTKEKYDYPWPMLMEVNKQNQLWARYRLANGGGGQFLIDQSGTILAVNPTVEEIKSFL